MVGACVAAQDGNVLNDHSIRHVDMVIERASKILSFPTENLPISGLETHKSPYEAFLLLVAIHFHDAGNFFGRSEHAETAANVIEKLRDFLHSNHLKIKTIQDVVKDHASNNPISNLPETEMINNLEIRCQFLTAVLRFADEITDDKSKCY
jgi:metal-dependent HD superfamily phosphatase/phosphodiesterase